MKKKQLVEGGRLEVNGLRRIFESDDERVLAVNDVTFEVEPGELFSLLGPSGCGKTTTLRCVAGLDTPTSGTIAINGDVVFSQERRIAEPAHARDLGMVFQSYAIWPHMTVFENVAFPLKNRRRNRVSGEELKRLVQEALATVQLDGLDARMATKLSGGQQQRLALARALVNKPSLILLDEPLSNLDAGLRDRMRGEIRQLQQKTGVTALYVTHDQTEAFSLSSRIAVMHSGRIVQVGTPREVYSEPATAYVATFVGRTNLLRPLSVTPGTGARPTVRVETKAGTLSAEMPSSLDVDEVDGVVIRPEDVEVSADALDSEKGPVFKGRIVQNTYLGAMGEFEVQVGEEVLLVHQFARDDFPVGSDVYVRLAADRCRAVTGVSDLQSQKPIASDDEDDAIGVLAKEGVLPLATEYT